MRRCIAREDLLRHVLARHLGGNMAKTPPLMDLPIQTADRGFYAGFSKDVAITSKILIAALIVWAIAVPETAATILGDLNGALLGTFSSWYIYVVALFHHCPTSRLMVVGSITTVMRMKVRM